MRTTLPFSQEEKGELNDDRDRLIAELISERGDLCIFYRVKMLCDNVCK